MSWWQHLLLFLLFFPPVGFVGGWCRKRCCQSCRFFSDNFTRSDSDTIGNGWNENSGDGDIASNKLSTTSSNAVFIQDAEHPDGDPDVKIEASVSIGTSGDVARIILARTGANDYWYVAVRAGSGAYIKIFQVVGGVATEKQTKSITRSTGSFPVCASIYGDNLVATVQGTSASTTISYTSSFSGASWGLGTGTITGTVTFDDVVASVVSEDCAQCRAFVACTHCTDDPNVTSEMLFEITGVTAGSCGSCSSVNGARVIPFAGPGGVGQCGWTLNNGSTCYTTHAIQLFPPGASGGHPTQYKLTGELIPAVFQDVKSVLLGTSKPTCNTIDTDLPTLDNDSAFECDISGATFHVSAI